MFSQRTFYLADGPFSLKTKVTKCIRQMGGTVAMVILPKKVIDDVIVTRQPPHYIISDTNREILSKNQKIKEAIAAGAKLMPSSFVLERVEKNKALLCGK